MFHINHFWKLGNNWQKKDWFTKDRNDKFEVNGLTVHINGANVLALC